MGGARAAAWAMWGGRAHAGAWHQGPARCCLAPWPCTRCYLGITKTLVNLLSRGFGLGLAACGAARAAVWHHGPAPADALAAKWPWLTSFQRELALSWQHWGQPACAKQGQMAAVACQAWHHGGTLKATPNLLSWQNGPG